MKRKNNIFLFLLILISINVVLLSTNWVIAASTSRPALKNLPTGWTVETVYENNYTPSAMCVDGNGDILFLDRNKYTIVKLDDQGNSSVYATTGTVLLDIIAFQPNLDRLLGIDATNRALFAFQNETFSLINEFTPDKNVSSPIAVDPVDDSFYGGTWQNNSKICHFNASGHYQSTIVDDVQGCGQIALMKSQNLLYYSEAYTGNIIEVNLSTLAKTTIATGLGIPSIGEAPALCVDNNDTLYSLHKNGTYNTGVFKYENGSFTHLITDQYGNGPIHWSTKFHAILIAASGGGCIVAYDPSKTEHERLTPVVNAPAIVETQDGLVLMGLENQVYQVTSSGISNFTSELPAKVCKFALDSAENIYLGLMNDTVGILKIYLNGSFTPWFTPLIYESLRSLSYDSKYNTMVLITANASANHTSVWRVPVHNPAAYERVGQPINGSVVPAGAVDDQGNIYVYEGHANVIYRIADGSNTLEILFSNVHFYELGFLEYSSIENALIAGYNDGLYRFPLAGGVKSNFATSDTGIDYSSLFETATHKLIGTHSSQIFRVTYVPGGEEIPGYSFEFSLSATIITLIYLSMRYHKKSEL